MKQLRILSLLLLLVMLTTACFGCSADPSLNGTGSSEPAESTSAETDAGTSQQEVEFSLVSEKNTDYSIIRSDSSSTVITEACVRLRTELEAGTEAKFGLTTDWHKRDEVLPETACEILVGETNRIETAHAYELIREKDYIIYEENDRIVILGGSEEKTVEAIDYFLSTYLNRESKNVTLTRSMRDIIAHTYPIGSIMIGSVNIRNYQVIIPSGDCPLFTKYAAYNLVDYLKSEAGITLEVLDDSAPEGPYELVIGATNRSGSLSASQVSLGTNDFILKQNGSSIYMYGVSYMVGGAVSELINGYLKSGKANDEITVSGIPTADTPKTFVFPEKATSALLLIGDGMGDNHIEATLHAGLPEFSGRALPNIGRVTTYSNSVQTGSAQYTDSAAAATALATGFKTNNGYIGVNPSKQTVQNVRELASKAGAKTAVLTTDLITGATPGGFLCHVSSRNSTEELQQQINNLMKTDKNLLYAIGLSSSQDLLVNKAREVLYGISSGGSDFFAMIEEAQIDKKAHKNDLKNVVLTTRRYNELIAYTVEFVLIHPSTALVITADHETGGIKKNATTGEFYFTSGNHTNTNVSVFAIGPGTECFNGITCDNTRIAKFLASVYSSNAFGDQKIEQ